MGVVAALVAVDRSPRARPHIGNVITSRADTAIEDAAPSRAVSHEKHAITPPKLASQSVGTVSPKKKKSEDSTLLVMLPDTLRNIPDTPPAGIWSDQGVSAPAGNSNGNAQTGGFISMSSIGGTSLPLTSPTGASPAGLPGPSGGGNLPGIPSLANPPPPIRQHNLSQSHSGFVLLAGGQGNGKFALASAQLYDPVNSTFVASSSMKQPRTDHAATVLPGGTILVSGGTDALGRSLSSAEIYNPASATFAFTGSQMSTARAEHSGTLISGCNCPADGQVLIAGGITYSQGPTIKNAELYDPTTGQFTPTGSMKTSRAMHTATLIESGPLVGDVLVAGGISDESGGDAASAELYDPATGQFTPTGAMSLPREGHSATWLDPSIVSGGLAGRVLIAGGGDVNGSSNTAETFNPQTGIFTPVAPMSTPRMLQAAVLLRNGEVLIAGGQSSDSDFLVSAELFNPATASFSPTGKMLNVHIGASATVLESGSVLVAGGRSNLGDIYDPAPGTFSPTGKMLIDVSESTATLIR